MKDHGTAGSAGGTRLENVPERSASRASSESGTSGSGYMEGDKYIRVDQDGNQVAVKMSRANDSAVSR